MSTRLIIDSNLTIIKNDIINTIDTSKAFDTSFNGIIIALGRKHLSIDNIIITDSVKNIINAMKDKDIK